MDRLRKIVIEVMRGILCVVTFLTFVTPVNAQSQYPSVPPPSRAMRPSFDCSRATASIERAICADDVLSELDARVGQLYKQALEMAPNRDIVISNQRAWVASRNSDCGKSASNQLYGCLQKAEQDRALAISTAISQRRGAMDRQRITQEDVGYERIEIDDFILDSKKLIASEKKIVIAGFYKKFGNIEQLYSSAQAAITSADNSGVIYLLSENATRPLRAYFLRCDRNPFSACPVRVRGYVNTCQLSVGSLSASKPCLIVESGATP